MIRCTVYRPGWKVNCRGSRYSKICLVMTFWIHHGYCCECIVIKAAYPGLFKKQIIVERLKHCDLLCKWNIKCVCVYLSSTVQHRFLIPSCSVMICYQIQKLYFNHRVTKCPETKNWEILLFCAVYSAHEKYYSFIYSFNVPQ